MCTGPALLAFTDGRYIGAILDRYKTRKGYDYCILTFLIIFSLLYMLFS